MNVREIPFGGWERCLRLANSRLEAVITLEVGPRIIRFGFIDGENEFTEYPDQMGKKGGEQYRSYGGHRLWIAPEERPRTYVPDNRPVEWFAKGGGVHVLAPVEESTGIQKELELWIDPQLDTLQVIHRLHNRTDRSVEASAWAISVMAPGGHAIIPQEPFQPHPAVLLPVRPLVLWSYTDMSDERWRWGNRFIQLFHDAHAVKPQKAGVRNTQGWAAYARSDHLFVKMVPFVPDAAYPDFGANVEVFTNAKMLELETLSPLRTIPPGAFLRHDEHWFLFRGVPVGDSEEEILAAQSNLMPQPR